MLDCVKSWSANVISILIPIIILFVLSEGRKNMPPQITENSNNLSTEQSDPIMKTVYLIRHAESDENRRLTALGRGLKTLAGFKLPSKSDVTASLELLDVKAQIDSDVSPIGARQIEQLGSILTSERFVQSKGIQLVAHSPLKRARQTCEGMLGCVTSSDPDSLEKKAEGVSRVVELPILVERTPMEWLPGKYDAFTKRIAMFETWLGEQEEEVIAIVGHSQYFKSMLGLPYKFNNCDVWELTYDASVKLNHDSVKSDIHYAENQEKMQKLQEKLDICQGSNEWKSESDLNDDQHPNLPISNSSEEDDFVPNNEDISLPRGWKSLTLLYRYKKDE